MTTGGIVIRHVSGAHVEARSLVVVDAWSGGPPSDESLARLTLGERDARDTNAHYESRVFANGAQTPRWLATATLLVDGQATIFQWLTNDAMRAPIASVLEGGIAEVDDDTPAPPWIDRGVSLQRLAVRFDAPSSYLGTLSYQVDHVLPAGALEGSAVYLVNATFFESARVHTIGWLVRAFPTLVLEDVVRRACDEVPWGMLVNRSR
jgi:hypothetical protein